MPRQQINIKLPPELIEVLREKASTEEITLTELIQRFCENGLGLALNNHQTVDTEQLYTRILIELDERILTQLDSRILATKELFLSEVDERISVVVDERISALMARVEQIELANKSVVEEAIALNPIEDAQDRASVEVLPNGQQIPSALDALEVEHNRNMVEDAQTTLEDAINCQPGPLHLWELAERLRVNEKTLLRLQDEPNFQDWTRQFNPGLGWGYFPDEETPYRVLDQDTAEGTAPVVFEEDESAIASRIPFQTQPFQTDSEVILEPAVDANEPVEEEVVSVAVKPGKQPPEAIRKLLEVKLALGQRVKKKELADLIGKTSESIRLRHKSGKLHEWGLRSVTGSKPEEFERICSAITV